MEAVIDLDGTLADNRHRKHLIEKEDKEWRKYYQKAEKDKVYEKIRDKVSAISKTHSIVILTMRSDEIKDETLKWLENHQIPFNRLIMLPKEQRNVKSELFKKEKVENLPNPDLAIDNKEENLTMFKNKGLKTYKANKGSLNKF